MGIDLGSNLWLGLICKTNATASAANQTIICRSGKRSGMRKRIRASAGCRCSHAPFSAGDWGNDADLNMNLETVDPSKWQ